MASNLYRERTYTDMAMGSTGLTNGIGENNCFLNSTVQVLWHLDAFRRSFRTIEQHTCTANQQGLQNGDSCIFCALKILFTHFQYSEQSTVAANYLRTAMADAFAIERRFQLRQMEDANECFEQIISRLHRHLTGTADEGVCDNVQCIAHQQFAMVIQESTTCVRCANKPDMGVAMHTINYVSTSLLLSSSSRSRHLGRPQSYFGETAMNESFGRVLKDAMVSGDHTPCQIHNCRNKTRLTKELINSPAFVTIGLNWDSSNPTDESLGAVLASVGCSLKLSDMFDKVPPEVARRENLSLLAMLCYYGKHYSAFLYRANRNVWISADDASVKEIGHSWEEVVQKCFKGRYQPLLLFYGSCDSANDMYATVLPGTGRKPIDTHGGDGGRGGQSQPDVRNTRNGVGLPGQTGGIPADGGNRGAGQGNQIGGQKKRPEPPKRNVDTTLVGRSRQPSYMAAVNSTSMKPPTGDNCLEDQQARARPSTACPRMANQYRPTELRPQTHHRRSCDAETLFAAHDFSRGLVVKSDVVGDRSSSPAVDTTGVIRRERLGSAKERAIGSGLRNSADWSQWIETSTGNDDDDDGDVAGRRYIDRRVVESVIRCRQMMTTGGNLLKAVRRQTELAGKTNLCNPLSVQTSGSGQSLDDDFSVGRRETIGDCGLKLETSDIDRDSGISGDRNSASSTSSGLSVESSLTSLISTDDYATGDRTSCSSSTMSCSSSLEQLDNPTVRTLKRSGCLLETPGIATTKTSVCRDSENILARLIVETSNEKFDRSLKRQSNKVVSNGEHRFTGNSGGSKSIQSQDELCSQLLLEADSLIDSCAEYERIGDVTKASFDCERAIDLLKTAEGATSVSQDMQIRLRMKRNAVVLTSRRLQRLVNGQSQTMTPSSYRSLAPNSVVDRARESSENNNCDKPSSTHLSKEEVGEILVEEMERRRHGGAPKPSVRSLPKDPTVDDRARLKYEDMLRRQLKTFTAKEKGHCINDGDSHENHERQITSGSGTTDVYGDRRLSHSGSNATETEVSKRPERHSNVVDAVDSHVLPHSSSDHSIRLPVKPKTQLHCPSMPGSSAAMEVTTTKTSNTHRRSVPDIFMSGNNVDGNGTRMKKTVTFSDNVRLLCCDADEIIPVNRGDCPNTRPTQAAVGILKNCQPIYASQGADLRMLASSDCTLHTVIPDLDPGRESDGTSADDSDAELDEVSPDGRSRCGLCRRKWADHGLTYCLDCGAYMSKLQPAR